MNEVTHKEIANQVEENRREIKAVHDDVAEIRKDQAKTLELVEAYAAVKTGSKFVAWFAKFMAGLLALWVFVKGGAQLLVEIGKPTL